MSKINVRVLIIVLAGLFSFMLFNGDALAIKRGGTITVAVPAGPTGWDPHIDMFTNSWIHTLQIYESLVMYNYKMEIVPSLATSWEQPDPLTLIFHLRKGVKFHNGREMVADDVRYSFDRAKDPKITTYASYFSSLKTTEVVDKYTVKLILSVPDPYILDYMAFGRFVGAIVPREVIEKYGNLRTETCGTGPFKVKKYVPGEYTVYERNSDYWAKGLPVVDKLVFKVIKDETSRLAALRKSTVDLGWVKEAQMADLARKTKGLRVLVPPPARQLKFFMTHDRFPFNNKKLRQAVSCAVDRKAMIKTVLMGFGQLTTCIPPANPYVLPQEEIANLPFYKRDLELSKRLLKEAGYPDGFEFTIMMSAHSPDYIAGPQMIQSNCRDVGIKVKLEQVDWGIHINRYKASDFQMQVMGGAWYPTADKYVRPYYHSKSSSNYSHYNNPEVDRLLDEALIEVNQEKRKEMWKKLQYVMAEDVPAIWPEAGPARFEIAWDYLKDYYFRTDTSRVYLRQTWLDK